MRVKLTRFVMLAIVLTANAAASSVTGTYTIGCRAGGPADTCGPPGNFFTGNISSAFYDSPDYSVSSDHNGEHYSATANMTFDLNPDNLHAYLSTSGGIQKSNSADSGFVSEGLASLHATVTDGIHFSSDILAPGSDVAFTITGVLHSQISSNNPNCPSGNPNGFASLTINGVGFPFGPDTWYHSTCGDGSDNMQATGTFHSTVGGLFNIVTTFALKADAGVVDPNTGSYYMTVDAANTANLYLTILTPGVTFVSDSGAGYNAPEPSTVLLGLLPALFFLWRARRQSASSRQARL